MRTTERVCHKIDDSCLSVAATKATARPADVEYIDACVQKRKTCVPAPFADDYCSSVLFSDAWVAKMRACLDKPCAETKACLDPLVK